MEWRRWIHALRARVRAIVRPRRAEHDLHDELSFHVAMQTQANVQNGLTEPEAERRARLALGGVAQAKERSRDVRPLRWLDTLAQDLRYAQRSLRRAPGFTAVALLTLALGIGANTAIFSIVNGVILRPLGYPKPEQLMFLTTQFSGGSAQFAVSPPEYLEFREINRSFSAVGAYRLGEVDLTGGDRPQRVRAAIRGRAPAQRPGRAAGAGAPVCRGRNRRQRRAAASARDSLARAVADRVWRAADRWTDDRSQPAARRGPRHHAARRRRDGQSHRDLAAPRPEPGESSDSREPLPSFSSGD